MMRHHLTHAYISGHHTTHKCHIIFFDNPCMMIQSHSQPCTYLVMHAHTLGAIMMADQALLGHQASQFLPTGALDRIDAWMWLHEGDVLGAGMLLAHVELTMAATCNGTCHLPLVHVDPAYRAGHASVRVIGVYRESNAACSHN